MEMASRFDIKSTDVARFVEGKVYGMKDCAYFFRIDSRKGMIVSGELFDWKGNSIKYYKRKAIGYISVWENGGWVKSKVEWLDFPIIDGGFDAKTDGQLKPKDVPKIISKGFLMIRKG